MSGKILSIYGIFFCCHPLLKRGRSKNLGPVAPKGIVAHPNVEDKVNNR